MDELNFKDHRKAAEKKSVWHYFFCEEKGLLAKCKRCEKIIKVSGGSTSGLHTHLRTSHNIILLKRVLAADTDPSTSADVATHPTTSYKSDKSKISSYFDTCGGDDSLAAVLSRMTATDGLPFNVFCTSIELRKSLMARGFEIPKSANTIRKIVIDYSNQKRSLLIMNLAELKRNGKRFSLSFDEWTSVRNRRYLNINVHSEKTFWNLGLTHVSGTMPAEKCIEIIERKLNAHELFLNKDIVCITTDGASVMKKIGKLIDANQQLCYAHGIQLAVISVLYQHNNNEAEENEEYTSEYEEDEENSSNGTNNLITIEDESDDHNINLSHKELLPIITKMRKVINLFRRSPTKNVVLQKYVQAECGQELMLILDTKTRWNSLLTMMERFFKFETMYSKGID